jgi:hypothetical protein
VYFGLIGITDGNIAGKLPPVDAPIPNILNVG